MRAHTVFTRPDAVEAWDALFRWRDGAKLQDTTIEETWRRVAGAVVPSEGSSAERWADKYASAFRGLQLLPDERLLRKAGTGGEPFPLCDPSAAINATAFVATSAFSPPRLLRSQLVDSASLTVRFLDAAALASPHVDPPGALRIGLIGVADAMEALKAAPGSAAASRIADELGQALCEGCLRGSVDLAIERGPRSYVDAALLRQWRRRGIPAALIARAELHGLRYSEMTAILPHPSLARLANGVRDGIDWNPEDPRDAGREHLRLAMQPYFDLPIAA